MTVGTIRYSVGNEHNPTDPWGRSELVIHPDGAAELRQFFTRKPATWTGRVDSGTLDSLWAALDQAGFPALPSALPPDSTVRRLTVEGGGTAQAVQVAWHDSPSLAGYAEVFAIIDDLISRLSDGAVRR